MRSARTWGWRRMRRCDDPSNDLGPLWSHHLIRIASSLRADMTFGKDNGRCRDDPTPYAIPCCKTKEERHDRTSATSKASLLYDGLSDLCRRTCSLRIDDRRDGARQPPRLLRYNRFARSDRCGPADRQAARSCQATGIHCRSPRHEGVGYGRGRWVQHGIDGARGCPEWCGVRSKSCRSRRACEDEVRSAAKSASWQKIVSLVRPFDDPVPSDVHD